MSGTDLREMSTLIRVFRVVVLSCLFQLNSQVSQAQKLHKITKLPAALHEISGLIAYNDSLFVCHNDGGDSTFVYFINLRGEMLHRVFIENASNVDWEDITSDNKGNIYIADIGNNLNNRQNLCIYRINSDSLLFKNRILAQKILFTYADQFAFPPENSKLNFDAEAIGFYRDTLFIFSKCRSEPFLGISSCYYLLPDGGASQIARKKSEIQLLDRKMRKDAVTSVCFAEDRCFLLTYSGILELDWQTQQAKSIKELTFGLWTQKEAFCKIGSFFYLVDEKFKFLGGKFYQIKY